jgi:serine protease AprX
MASITVNGNTIDPAAAHNVSPHARDSNFILIQGQHVLSVDEKQILEKKGVLIQEYVAEYTYLCRYEPDDLQTLRSLPFVRTANV